MAEWTCESCVHYPPSSFGGKPCWMCNTNDPLLNRYEKREEPVTTNADRIRAMSDEELAKEIAWLVVEAFEQVTPEVKWDENYDARISATAEDVLDWLQSPAGGGGDG